MVKAVFKNVEKEKYPQMTESVSSAHYLPKYRQEKKILRNFAKLTNVMIGRN